MENETKTLERENPSLQTSSKSNITNSSCVENPSTPKPMSVSEANGCPTTFIQADTKTFKHVVQMLTGSPETTKQASKPAGPAKNGPKKQGFKLHERRNSLKNLKMIIPGLALDSVLSPSQSKMLSPSVLDLHKLVLSPETPLYSSPGEKTIAEKGFYLLGSPEATPRVSEPQLLPLFPVTSPRVSGTS